MVEGSEGGGRIGVEGKRLRRLNGSVYDLSRV